MQKWKDIKIKMEFNKYDYFYSSKNTKESLYRTKFAIQLFNFENNICEFEHEKRIIILTLKKEECMKIMKNWKKKDLILFNK